MVHGALRASRLAARSPIIDDVAFHVIYWFCDSSLVSRARHVRLAWDAKSGWIESNKTYRGIVPPCRDFDVRERGTCRK